MGGGGASPAGRRGVGARAGGWVAGTQRGCRRGLVGVCVGGARVERGPPSARARGMGVCACVCLSSNSMLTLPRGSKEAPSITPFCVQSAWYATGPPKHNVAHARLLPKPRPQDKTKESIIMLSVVIRCFVEGYASRSKAKPAARARLCVCGSEGAGIGAGGLGRAWDAARSEGAAPPCAGGSLGRGPVPRGRARAKIFKVVGGP